MKNRVWFIFGIMAVLATGGCAERQHGVGFWNASPRVAAGEAAPPVPSDAKTIAAEYAYRACLTRAARYIDSGGADPTGLASLIAPMCYPQFGEFQAAADIALSERDRRAFDYAGDQRQIDIAGDAVRIERSQAALSAPASPLLAEHSTK